jgi:LuxR family maltose regulon positive regulatory protein
MPENSSIEGYACVQFLRHATLTRMGRETEANEVLLELTEAVQSRGQFLVPNLTAYQTRLALLDADKDVAGVWLDNYFVVETNHIELFRSYQHFTTARAYMVLGDTNKAMELILLLKDFGENLNRPTDFSEASVLESALLWSLGQKKEAAATLEAAIERLAPYGFIRIVDDEGAAILPVLKRVTASLGADTTGTADTGSAASAAKGRLTRAFLNEIMMAAYGFSKLHQGVTANINVRSQKPVKLSKQQAQMLTFLSQGYSNAMIAQKTGLAIPTIKSHTSIAYRKLAVNNAMDAVLKARERGWSE